MADLGVLLFPWKPPLNNGVNKSLIIFPLLTEQYTLIEQSLY